MVREDNQAEGYSCEWVYDEAGNILARIAYDYTTGDLGEIQSFIDYFYDDSEWGDLLTSFDGMEVWYDDIGNVLFDGMREYTWQNGRELASITLMGEDIPWNFTYDADGMRVRRAYGNTVYRYVYNGSQLGQMTVGTNTLRFAYDADGTPVSVIYNGTTYYYETNLQGDVVAIRDSSGAVVVAYTYTLFKNRRQQIE